MKLYISLPEIQNLDRKYLTDLKYIAGSAANMGYDIVIGRTTKESISKELIGLFQNYGRKIDLETIRELKDDEKTSVYINFEYCDSTFTRTKRIYDKSDVLLIMPGDIGTIAELMSFIEEAKNKHSNKTIILYNHNSYYNKLLRQILSSIYSNFSYEDVLNYLYISTSSDDIIRKMEELHLIEVKRKLIR